MNRNSRIFVNVLLAALIAGGAANALAETQWEKTHPRRDQVNDRLENQNRRIHQQVQEGDLTKAQGMRLHRADRAIRREERVMASRHHGHITRREQLRLNKQENAVSRKIGQ